jgi:hypothetical protein
MRSLRVLAVLGGLAVVSGCSSSSGSGSQDATSDAHSSKADSGVDAKGDSQVAPKADATRDATADATRDATTATTDATSDAAADAAKTLACGAKQQLCGVEAGAPYCASTKTDNANCGACGNVCGAGLLCSKGSCGSTCSGDETPCTPDGGAPYCASTDTDNANCGACGTVCASGTYCSKGACKDGCGAGETLCKVDGGAPYCANEQTDTANCGACGTVCTSSQTCADAGCYTVCGPALTNCSNECVDKTTDPTNCGACSNKCTEQQVCGNGSCQRNVFYVDVINGNDANDGSESMPWQTITHAITTLSATAVQIMVAAGTYSTLETFPISPKANQILIGGYTSTGHGTGPSIIEGAGAAVCASSPLLASEPFPTALFMGPGSANARLSGFSVQGGSNTMVSAVVCGAPVTIDNTIFTSPSTGAEFTLLLAGGAALTLTSSVCEGAFFVLDDTTLLVARGNTFSATPSGFPVSILLGMPATGDAGSLTPTLPHLDFGTAASPGGNTVNPGFDGGMGLFVGQTAASVLPVAGNTWAPGVEGADSQGHYAHQLWKTDEEQGPNFVVLFADAGGGGLQF